MLTVVDTKTGEQMTDESIVDNVRPFLTVLSRFSYFDPVNHLPYRRSRDNRRSVPPR